MLVTMELSLMLWKAVGSERGPSPGFEVSSTTGGFLGQYICWPTLILAVLTVRREALQNQYGEIAQILGFFSLTLRHLRLAGMALMLERREALHDDQA